MAWTRVQATQGALTDTGAATNSYLLVPGSPITVGNTIVLFAHVLTDNPIPTISGAIDSVGNAYTRVGRVVWTPSAGVTHNLQIFIAPITAGGGTTPQITVSSNSGGTFNCEQMGMLEYASLPNSVDVVALGTGVVNSLTIPSGTTLPTAGAGELVLGFFADTGIAAANLTVGSASPAATRVAALSTNQQAIRKQSWMITEGTTTASATASITASASGSDSGVGMVAVFGAAPLPAIAMHPTASMTVGATAYRAVSVVQSGGWFSTTTPPSLAVSMSPITPGNSVVVVAQSFSAVNVASISGCGVVWQKAISGIAQGVASGSLDVWYGVNSPGGNSTATILFGGARGGGSNNFGVIMETSPISLEQAVKVESVTGLIASPAVTPGAVGDLLIGTITANTTFGSVLPWHGLNPVGDYQIHGYLVATSTASQQMTPAGSPNTGYSAATVVFKPANTGVKFYTAEDLGGGVQAVNLPDPLNPQDVATKHYVDNHPPTLFSGQILWETAYVMICNNNSYTGGWATLTTGPNVQTITKQRANTGIRVKMSTTCFATVAGNIYYGVSVNGSPLVQLGRMYFNTINTHMTFPWTKWTLLSGTYSQLNTTGSMNVTFYVSTDAGVTWNTNSGDWVTWLISEIMP
jgi:hypothetical protein